MRTHTARLTSPRRSGGQALILALALLTLGVLALVQLYQAGQLVHEKTRLAHATDAAAYGGAVVQARALNFLALANRAQVAHQVALAHLVTLDAWASFGVTEAGRAAQGNPPAYLIGALFGARHGAAYAAALRAGTAAALRPALAQAMAEHDRVVHEVLWPAQQAVQQGLAEYRYRAMLSILQANFPGPGVAAEVGLDREPLHDDAADALVPALGRGADPLREWTLRGLQDHLFLAPRHHETRNTWMVSSRCPGLRHILRRRGATRLDESDNWWADDTQSYHALRSNRWIGCYYREYPMAWAETQLERRWNATELEHVENPRWTFADEPYWRWVQRQTGWQLQTGSSNPLANSWAVSQRRQQRGRGFGGMVDLRTSARHTPLRVAIRAHRPLSALRVAGGASQVRLAGKWLRPVWNLPGDQLASIAAAEIRFQPAGGDVRAWGSEAPPAHLFTPGWTARLVPVNALERERARQRQEVL